MKFKIVTDNIVYRYYEVEADNEEDALKKYYDELPKHIDERWGDSYLEIEEVRPSVHSAIKEGQ